jgi:transcriptional regulator with XRE-family HTH domain
METLNEYVARILKQKGLSYRKVESNCGKRLTASYIGRIARGKAENLSMETVTILATGLGVELPEILAVYGKPEKEVNLLLFADAVLRLAMNTELIDLVRGWNLLNKKQKKAVLDTFNYFDQKRKTTSRKKS